MQTKLATSPRSRGGYALAVVLVLAGVSIVLYASLARWSCASAVVNDRHNTYNAAVAAAEAADEMVLSYMVRDFFNQSYDPSRASYYAGLVPTTNWAAAYQFGDGAGGLNCAWVSSSALTVTTNLDSQYTGLYGLAYACTVRASAQPLTTSYPIAPAVQEQGQLAAIPLFQFAIFSSMDLEINPGPAMKITGKVHSNANLYTAPQTGLEYADTVSAVGKIVNDRNPNDPNYGTTKVVPVYDAGTNQFVSSLNMPVGTTNSPTAVQGILAVPPPGENPLSDTGRTRYYNQTDLIVTTTPTAVTVQAGSWDSFVSIATNTIAGTNGSTGYSFVATNASFWDAREGKWTVTTDIDVGAFNQWATNAGTVLNGMAAMSLGHHLNSIYINDQRQMAGKLTVVRVSNGQQLPSDGLTVATSLPLYVQGHFNAPDTTSGSTNTSQTKPASLLGDAITVLSGNWSDANSSLTMAQRPATDTTVNAAFLAGIVPTGNYNGTKHYSGGVENFPRFLEDWNNQTFTYNGSMVLMFPSQYATNFWISPGTYYNAPVRKWAFDNNFRDYRHLPPATPQVRKLIRGQWSVVAAN